MLCLEALDYVLPHFDELTHVVLTFCIKPGCLAVVPQSKSAVFCSSAAVVPQSKSIELCSSAALCHKVNLPRYEAHRRHFMMTCDIYGTEINKLNENTEKVNEVSRTHISLKALMNDSLENCEIERCNVSEPLNAYIC